LPHARVDSLGLFSKELLVVGEAFVHQRQKVFLLRLVLERKLSHHSVELIDGLWSVSLKMILINLLSAELDTPPAVVDHLDLLQVVQFTCALVRIQVVVLDAIQAQQLVDCFPVLIGFRSHLVQSHGL
jgi:hypothetical protein